MFIADSNPTLTNVSFSGNQAGDGISGSGGGLSNHEGEPHSDQLSFCRQRIRRRTGAACVSGGAGSNVPSSTRPFPATMQGVSGGGLSTTSPNMIIDNTVIWNNQDSSGIGTADASISGTIADR